MDSVQFHHAKRREDLVDPNIERAIASLDRVDPRRRNPDDDAAFGRDSNASGRESSEIGECIRGHAAGQIKDPAAGLVSELS
jgi:hypothetical protein